MSNDIVDKIRVQATSAGLLYEAAVMAAEFNREMHALAINASARDWVSTAGSYPGPSEATAKNPLNDLAEDTHERVLWGTMIKDHILPSMDGAWMDWLSRMGAARTWHAYILVIETLISVAPTDCVDLFLSKQIILPGEGRETRVLHNREAYPLLQAPLLYESSQRDGASVWKGVSYQHMLGLAHRQSGPSKSTKLETQNGST